MNGYSSVILMLVMISTCTLGNRSHQLLKDIIRIEESLNVYDTVIFDSWDVITDTIIVAQLDLTSEYNEVEFPLKYFNEYKCSIIGYFESSNITILLYKTFTTEAGDGSPVLVMSTRDKSLKQINSQVILRPSIDDLYFTQRSHCIVNADSITVFINTVKRGVLGTTIVAQTIAQTQLVYSINIKGEIVLMNESEQVVFEDRNPAIILED